ncbi:hypothetical protein B0H17DRAFT_959505, partial [Mycena rosella]
CAIPVIEDLLPEPYNSEILDILFTLAEWHTLAKLKLHTDATLNLLALANKGVGRLLRRFKRVTCPDFATKELPSEEASRGRAQARKAAKGKGKARARPVKTTPKVKEYSLLTYKLHSLGDYLPTIRWFGTSDSYSTQPVRAKNIFSADRYTHSGDRESWNIAASNIFTRAPIKTVRSAK